MDEMMGFFGRGHQIREVRHYWKDIYSGDASESRLGNGEVAWGQIVRLYRLVVVAAHVSYAVRRHKHLLSHYLYI